MSDDKLDEVMRSVGGISSFDYTEKGERWMRIFVERKEGFDSLDKALEVFGQSAKTLKELLALKPPTDSAV